MAVAVEVSAASRESGRSFSSCADLVPQIRSGTHREQNGPTAPRRGEKEIPNQRWVRVDLRWNLGFALNRMLTSAQERIAVLSRAGASGSQYSHGPFSRESFTTVRKSRAETDPPTANAVVPAEGM